MASIFPDLVCSVYEVTKPTGVCYSFMISFKGASIFLDLGCSVYGEKPVDHPKFSYFGIYLWPNMITQIAMDSFYLEEMQMQVTRYI